MDSLALLTSILRGLWRNNLLPHLNRNIIRIGTECANLMKGGLKWISKNLIFLTRLTSRWWPGFSKNITSSNLCLWRCRLESKWVSWIDHSWVQFPLKYLKKNNPYHQSLSKIRRQLRELKKIWLNGMKKINMKNNQLQKKRKAIGFAF